jgi:phage terminase large subunit-like protein
MITKSDRSLNERQEQQDFLLQAGRNNLMNFSQLTDPRYMANWHHEEIAHILEEAYEKVQRGERVRIILEVPPRHGKSELATKKFPAWCLGKDPTLPFIVTSYAADLAEAFGQGTKDIMLTPQYHALFPKTTLRKDTKAKGNWATTRGGSYLAVGVGGPITGKGARIAVIDDPVKNREEAESPTQRQKIWDWYTSTLYTRLEGAGAIIVIMTRWHSYDLVGMLLEQEKENIANGDPAEGWQVIRFPALSDADSVLDPRDPRNEENLPLWPEKFDVPTLENIKKNSIYDWVSLYQQTPIASETQEFKPEYFKSWTNEKMEQLEMAGRLRYYTTLDPAISQSSTADNAVICTVAKEIDGPNWYRRREDAGKFTPKQMIDILFKHQGEFKSEVGVEVIAFQKALKYMIDEEMRRRQQYFTVHELKSQTAKEVRIRGLLPLYQNGVIWHMPSDAAYEEEALTFPKGKHDDRVDAMAMQLMIMKNTMMSNVVKSTKKHFTGYFRRK